MEVAEARQKLVDWQENLIDVGYFRKAQIVANQIKILDELQANKDMEGYYNDPSCFLYYEGISRETSQNVDLGRHEDFVALGQRAIANQIEEMKYALHAYWIIQDEELN